MGVTEVVRGGDLLKSTARQLLIYKALLGDNCVGEAEKVRKKENKENKEEEEGEKDEKERIDECYNTSNGEDIKNGNEKGGGEMIINKKHVRNVELDKPVTFSSSSSSSTSSSTSSSFSSSSSSSSSFSSSSSSFSSSTGPSTTHDSIPFMIPTFYHCDLVRDYNTNKRISKRNQENDNNDITTENSQYQNTSNINQKNHRKGNELNLSSPMHIEDILVQNETENNSGNENGQKNEINCDEIISLNQSIQISSISSSSSSTSSSSSSSSSMNNKMDTSSEKFTLRYLREMGYTPDRIRIEILDITPEFIY